MYRQVLIHPDDRQYQQIVWSDLPNQNPSTFQLTTVTYGVTCAPFLAIRTLLQLAEDDGKRFPIGAEIVRKHMDVDDVLAGGDSIKQAQDSAMQVDKLLMAGGFSLQKWASNNSAVLSSIEDTSKVQSHKPLGDGACLRALGLSWNPNSDAFQFSFCENPNNNGTGEFTRRSVLSVIASLFDPLGWLAPVVIVAKIFMQSLWTSDLDWDTRLLRTLATKWETILEKFRGGVTFSLPRWLGTLQTSTVELHGFSDASRTALSAVVYVRVMKGDSPTHVTLLTAKTKVAPLKPVTIPRLELSAAVLLTQLVVRVREVRDLRGVPVHSWVDSSVALAWIRGHPSRWKEFDSNRVARIQELLPNGCWKHVAGAENPADVASKGIFPADPFLLNGGQAGVFPDERLKSVME